MKVNARWASGNEIGWLITRLRGSARNRGRIYPGETVHLKREHHDRTDPSALAVLDPQGRKAGYIGRRKARWLAPLLDGGLIDLDVRAFRQIRHVDRIPDKLPLRLGVRLTEAGSVLLDPSAPAPQADRLLHKALVSIWRDLNDPGLEAGAASRLRQLLRDVGRQPLRPETRLLMELLPSLDHMNHHGRAQAEGRARWSRALGMLEPDGPIWTAGWGVVPLKAPPNDQPVDSLLLDQALEGGQAEVRELHASGEVPTVLVVNRSPQPVLAIEGLLLLGLKQNRVVNETVLIAAHSIRALAVSCVERGRWDASSPVRESRMSPPSFRARKLRTIQQNRCLHGTGTSDQHELWAEVDGILKDLAIDSPTASLAEAFETSGEPKPRGPLTEPPANTTGVVGLVDGRPVLLEVLDSPEKLAQLWPMFCQALAMEAKLRGRQKGHSDRTDHDEGACRRQAAAFLEQVGSAMQARGCPEDESLLLDVAGNQLTGSGLAGGQHLYHLAALASPD